MKWFAVFLISVQFLVANVNLNNIPLRAKVVGVASWDVLNIRQEPNWHSKKVGFVKNGNSNIGIYKCKKVGRSGWCKIFYVGQIGQYGDDGFNEDSKAGWVNAKYLSGYNRGYVVLDNKPNCDYALECRNNRCKIVSNLTTRWVSRSRLKATNSGDIGGGKDASGMCETHLHIKDYTSIYKTTSCAICEVKELIKALRDSDYHSISKLIHPKYGLKIAINSHFSRHTHTFSKAEIANPSSHKLFWGYTQGRGDEIYKSLKEILRDLKLPKVIKLDKNANLKGFRCRGYCKAYLLKNIPKSIYKYKGVLVIMEKHNNRWYLVGLLKSVWSI